MPFNFLTLGYYKELTFKSNFMIYQIGIIAVLILLALVVSKRLNKKNDLIFEEDMEDEELKKIDEEIH